LATRNTEQLSLICELATDDELSYRCRQTAVKMLRAGWRNRYPQMMTLAEELAIVTDVCKKRGLSPFDGGWYELTAPSELGRWL
jgi:hypothetical protein